MTTKHTEESAYQAATQALEDGKLETVVGICEDFLTHQPDNLNLLVLLARVEARQTKYISANKHFQRIIELAPGQAWARELLDKAMAEQKIAEVYPPIVEFLTERHVYMDYPRNIGIETVGRCNANCGFCPHEELDRKQLEMSDFLFEKILTELTQIPPDLPIKIFPNLINEPFMDKKIFDRLKRINTALPRADIHIFTNLNVRPKNFIEKLSEIDNIDTINISFNAANKHDYTASMRLDFDRTVDNIRELMSEHRARNLYRGGVILSRVKDGTAKDDEFESQCTALFCEFESGKEFLPHAKPRTNFLGSVAEDQSPIPYAFSCGAWLDINIMCDGVVPFCCMDAKGDYPLGNANQESILELYNAPSFRSLREDAPPRESIHPCNTCSLMQ